MLKKLFFEVGGTEIALTDSQALELFRDLAPLYQGRMDDLDDDMDLHAPDREDSQLGVATEPPDIVFEEPYSAEVAVNSP